MKIIQKYKDFLNNPEIQAYIGDSKRRRILLKVITSFAILFLLLAAVFLGFALGKVLFTYFS